MMLWKPTPLLTDQEGGRFQLKSTRAYIIVTVSNYLSITKEQFNYNVDQALGMLFYHNYDVNKAISDLPNFCPLQGIAVVL